MLHLVCSSKPTIHGLMIAFNLNDITILERYYQQNFALNTIRMIISSFCYVTSSVNRLLANGIKKVYRGQRADAFLLPEMQKCYTSNK